MVVKMIFREVAIIREYIPIFKSEKIKRESVLMIVPISVVFKLSIDRPMASRVACSGA